MGEIRYWIPIEKAREKMVEVLFRSFDFGEWMVIAFTAFLAGEAGGADAPQGNRFIFNGEEGSFAWYKHRNQN